MVETLLATKLLLPTSRGDLVSRQHLFDMLEQSLTRKLTVVSAPAGFGKTTLIGEWIIKQEISAAWLSLDKNDNDPIRFLSYCIRSLQIINANLGETVLEILQSPQPQINEPLLIALINEIASTISHEFVFVLDDYHFVESPRIHEIITFLLNNLPPSMHMMVATRSDPSLPVALLRGRGELIELRQGDLRFTIEEVTEFLTRVKGLQLTPDQITALVSRTEGWISGLHMAAISMQGREDISAFVQSFTGSNRYIFDYLIEEILNHQPLNIQEFLLHTSILDRLTGDLCNVLMAHADGQTILEYLEHSNLFIVPLDDERHWYRYHQLFADLLQKQLMQKNPELIQGLHQKASVWFYEKELPEDAITHALAARNYELAARILEQNITVMMGRGEMSLIENFFGLLPEEIVHNHPILSIQRAWGLALTGRLDESEGKLQEIENQPDIVECKDFSGNIALIRALIANIQGDEETAISLANRAHNLISKENMMVRSMIPYILGNGYLASGNLGKAEQAFEQIKLIGIATNNLWTKTVAYHRLAQLKKLRGRLKEGQALCEELLEIARIRRAERYGFFCEIYFELGDILREYNNLDSATNMVIEALDHLEYWRIPTDLVVGYTTLARIYLAQVDLENAANAIRKAQSISQPSNIFRVIQKKLDACQVQLWLQQGNLFDASLWANEIEAESNSIDQGNRINFANEVDFIMLARVWMAKGTKEKNKSHLDKANILLSILANSAQDGQRFGRLIEILALQAIVLVYLGDENKALEVLEDSLSLSMPNGYVRVFLDEGQAMQNLLFRAKKKGIGHPYTEKLLEYFDKNLVIEEKESPSFDPPELVEPLSDREMEVLILLPTRLTATEMAEQLIVAKSTIDTHIKHIYSKLGVNRRIEAIQRAKELGLL